MSRRKQSNPKPLKRDDDWDSEEDKQTGELMTDQSEGGEGATSPLSNQSESVEGREEEVESSAPPSPGDQDHQKALKSSTGSFTNRQVDSGRGTPPTGTAHTCVSTPTSQYCKSQVKRERSTTPPTQPPPPTPSTMKEEACTPSPPTHAPTTPTHTHTTPTHAHTTPTHTHTPTHAHTTLSAEVEAARQQLTSMIQGLPLLSMLPALHRLAPAVVSLASGLGSMGGSALPGSSATPSSGDGGTTCVCGIRFSSASNLDAHRMSYCAARPHLTESDGVNKEMRTSPSGISPRSEAGGDEDSDRMLRCPHCPYTTTHKLSLNGHMNIHTSPDDLAKASASPQGSGPSSQGPLGDTRATDRYCSDCDIQFSSVKTFRVHKTHYCQTRHVLKGGNKSPAREDASASTVSTLAGMVSAAAGSGQPILALPTNPILLVPYSLVAGAQLLPPHVLPQAGAAVVLPNGQVQPLSPGSLTGQVPPPMLSPSAGTRGASPARSIPPQTSPQLNQSLPPKQSPKDESKVKSGNGEASGKRRGEGECPLDLTTKRPKLTVKTDLLSDDEKENREVNTPTKSPVPKLHPGSSYNAGEFEGKLLASPPRPSPSSETDGQSAPRSPRPASAAPTIGSPRGLPDSPRPSTSARSPGQQPQVPGLPQLPPGFPSLLASLESLGGMSLAQGLQGVPPELALKLLNSDLLMNGLAPIPSAPVIVKQGEAKCNECNIVFYKEENLQVHKRHYCAARPGSRDDDRRTSNKSPAAATLAGEAGAGTSRGSPTPAPDVAAPCNAKAAVSVSKEAAKPSKPLLQFICTACGIKFTSPDNLKAHQTYYCPKREGASGEEGVTKGLWRCPRCRCAMPETLQAAHRCMTPSPAPSHGWKCPCCPIISPTAAAAQKHLETHAGIKGFRCTICGYRGNTLRGMRTHIRMHFEKRTNDLQEENFISCILDEDDGSRRAAEAQGVADLPRVILENPTLSALLAEGVAECSDQPISCHFCPFIAPYRSNLARHLALVHKVGFDAKLTQDLQALLEGHVAASTEASSTEDAERRDPVENGNPISSPPLPAVKLEPEVKLEVEEFEDKIHTTPTNPHSPMMDNESTTEVAGSGSSSGADVPRYCKACNITFSYTESFLAHKRFYCSKPESTTPPETAVQ
ncbi:zinc finger protein ush-like [Cherax quadricarinatus]